MGQNKSLNESVPPDLGRSLLLDPMAVKPNPAEPVSANQNAPRGQPLIKTDFEIDFQIRFHSNLAKIISSVL
jgi:hypothetical protein